VGEKFHFAKQKAATGRMSNVLFVFTLAGTEIEFNRKITLISRVRLKKVCLNLYFSH